jgi:lipopolysaccharide export system protein LptA
MTARRLGLALVALSLLACGRVLGRRPARLAGPAVIAPDSIVAPPAGQLDTITLQPPAAPEALVNEIAKKKPAEKAGDRCLLDLENTDLTRMQSIKDPISGKYTTYIGGGVVGICQGQDIRITADSAESYEQSGLYYLIGTVKYREKRVSLDSDRLTYFKNEERVLAEGNVVAVMQDSSSMTGPRAEYFRAVQRVRTTSRMVATGRPTLKMYETDSLGDRLKDPVILVADNIYGEGDTLFTAVGKVDLQRVDLTARGDSAFLDNVRQYSRLMKEPTVESKGSQSFVLTGRVIDVFGRSRQVERVLSIDSASAVSDDLTLRSDTLDLRVKSNLLERAFAFGRRASAVTPLRTIVADSLDVRLPGQKVRELHAVRNAYAESEPDTTFIVSRERDWLRGDTVLAIFDSLPPEDSTTPDVRELVASGNASSFYQMQSNDGRKDAPGLNWVRGRQIRVDFKAREVQTVTVIDQASGIFLEALPDSVQAAQREAGSRASPRPPVRRPPPQSAPAGRRPRGAEGRPPGAGPAREGQ